MEQSESRRSTPTDTALTKDTGGRRRHYGNYIHYCRITDTTQCSGVVTELCSYTSAQGELLVTEGPQPCPPRHTAPQPQCRKTSRSLPDGEPFEGCSSTSPCRCCATLPQNAISLRGLPPPASAHTPCRAMRSSTTLFSTLASYFKSERFPPEAHGVEMQGDGTHALIDRARPHGAAVRLRGTRQERLRQFMEQYTQELDLAGLAHSQDARSRHSSRSFPLPSACRRADGSRRRLEEARASCKASGPPPRGGIQEPQPLLARLQAAVRPTAIAGGRRAG